MDEYGRFREVRMKKTKILMLIVFMTLAAGIVRTYAEDPDKKQNSGGGSYFWCPWCDERQEYKNPNNVSPDPQDYQRRYDLEAQKKNSEKQEVTPEKARFIMESYLFSRQNPGLKLGKITDRGSEFQAEVLRKDGSLFELVKIDKQTGEIRGRQE